MREVVYVTTGHVGLSTGHTKQVGTYNRTCECGQGSLTVLTVSHKHNGLPLECLSRVNKAMREEQVGQQASLVSGESHNCRMENWVLSVLMDKAVDKKWHKTPEYCTSAITMTPHLIWVLCATYTSVMWNTEASGSHILKSILNSAGKLFKFKIFIKTFT